MQWKLCEVRDGRISTTSTRMTVNRETVGTGWRGWAMAGHRYSSKRKTSRTTLSQSMLMCPLSRSLRRRQNGINYHFRIDLESLGSE